MLIKVRLHPSSSSEKINKKGDGSLEIWLKQKAIDNKANIALIRLLKKHLKKPVKIKKGLTSRNKIIEAAD